MVKTKVAIEELREDVEIPESHKPKPRRGKNISSKPSGFRVINDSPVKTSRPVSVYKERIVDVDGMPHDVIWYHTEDSQTIGKEEITRYNEKTETEYTEGFDYTIEYSKEEAEKIRKLAFGRTKFYKKDGGSVTFIEDPQKDF